MRLPDIPEHFWLCDVPGTDTFDADGPLSPVVTFHPDFQ